MTFPTNAKGLRRALPVNVLMDGWAEGAVCEHGHVVITECIEWHCHECGPIKDAVDDLGPCEVHIDCGYPAYLDTCSRCSGTGRIPFARKTCERCGGSGGEPDPAQQCDECKGTGTVPLDIVLASGECETCKGNGLDPQCEPGCCNLPCPTCHATGYALIDPFGGHSSPDSITGTPDFDPEFTDAELTTLYVSIAKLRDTCKFHMVLGGEASVERMREMTRCSEPNSPRNFGVSVASALLLLLKEPGYKWHWPLDNIVYYNAQLEEVVV